MRTLQRPPIRAARTTPRAEKVIHAPPPGMVRLERRTRRPASHRPRADPRPRCEVAVLEAEGIARPPRERTEQKAARPGSVDRRPGYGRTGAARAPGRNRPSCRVRTTSPRSCPEPACGPRRRTGGRPGCRRGSAPAGPVGGGRGRVHAGFGGGLALGTADEDLAPAPGPGDAESGVLQRGGAGTEARPPALPHGGTRRPGLRRSGPPGSADGQNEVQVKATWSPSSISNWQPPTGVGVPFTEMLQYAEPPPLTPFTVSTA